MMLTARFKTCALAAFLLTACLLLPDTQAKAESISLPEPVKASQTQPEAAAENPESAVVLTPLSYETVVETIEEPAPEAALETPEETPAPAYGIAPSLVTSVTGGPGAAYCSFSRAAQKWYSAPANPRRLHRMRLSL